MSPVTLVLYSRNHCHLCEDMYLQLEELQGEYGFELVVRDVDTDPDWTSAYGDEVPLLFAEDVEICRYFLDLERLKARISLGASS
jgi:thiol-disulfide isomerase/thioredoxin